MRHHRLSLLTLLLLLLLLQSLPPPEGYNEEWLAGFVERLSAFDRDMNTVVQRSRILAGAPPPALAAAGAIAAGPLRSPAT